MKRRSQIDEKYRWDLSFLCKDDTEFEAKFAKAQSMLAEGKIFKGKLKDKKILKKYLDYERKFYDLVGPISFYCSNMRNTDLSSTKYNDKLERLENLCTEFDKNTSYVGPEMAKFSNSYYDELIADPRFREFDYRFKVMKKTKKHSPAESEAHLLASENFSGFEEIMSLFSDVGLKFEGATDSKGKKYKLDQSTMHKYLESHDSVLRRTTSQNIHKAYGQFIDFLTENYVCSLKRGLFYARAYKYKTAFESYFDKDDISTGIYDLLIKKVNENIPLINEFFALKRKKLGQKALFNYDLFVPLKKSALKFSFEQGFQIVKDAMSILGDDYVAELDNAFKERRIDVYPNENKRTGAYENAIYGYAPIVLTNYVDTLDSVSTLAHELGHAMHSYYSNKNQPHAKANYPIFLAEIASTTNELLLNAHLLKTLPQSERLNLIDDLLVGVQSTIFRQTMFSEFEKFAIQSIDRGESLDKEKLCNQYFSLCKKYMPKLSLIPELRYEWARIPHFFMGFYVYKYATGMICAFNFSSRILKGEKGALEKYKTFLSSGGKYETKRILKEAGCDLEDERTYDIAFAEIRKYIEEYKKLTKNH